MSEEQAQALIDFVRAEVQVSLARAIAPERMENWIFKREDALDRLNKTLPKKDNQ